MGNINKRPLTISHISHGQGQHLTGHAGKNIATDGAPKRVSAVPFHGGMSKQSKSGAASLGGDHASALDSLSGVAVVPGAIKTAPGYGNAGIQSGHPFAKAPAGKNLKAVAPGFGMKARGAIPADAMHQVGEAMLAEAFANSGGDDRAAHGRKPDGSK
jgi:hypothetical protein